MSNQHSRRRWLAGLAAAVGVGVALLAISGSATAKPAGGSGLAGKVAPNVRAAAGPGGTSFLTPPLAAPLVDPVLYDQNDNGYADAYVSWSNYPNALADDFIVPAATNWNITQVFTAGADFGDLTSVTVTIYSDSSGSPGSQVYTVTVPSGSFTDSPDPLWNGSYGYPGGDLTIPVDTTLGAGHYWLSVVGNGGTVYWWGIRSVVSNDQAMSNGAVCGGGWTDMGNCFDISGDPNPADLMFTLSGTISAAKEPQVDYVQVLPAAATAGAHITLRSKAEDPNGLTNIYYNLFTSGGTFVCALAHVSIAGDPTTYTDSGTTVSTAVPFAGLNLGAGDPACPSGGISKGAYVIAANWEDTVPNQEGAPDYHVLANYPASAQTPFYYTNALTPSTTCNGFYSGTAVNVVVPKGATCTLVTGSTVTHDVKVQKGGTLNMSDTTVDHDVTVDGTATICSSDVLHDLTADGPVTIGGPSCAGNTIGVDLTVQNVKGGATIEDNSIGHNLNVTTNQGGVTIEDNSVSADMTVQHNGAPTTVSDNSVGHNAVCHNNLGQTGSGNTAGGSNTCPA